MTTNRIARLLLFFSLLPLLATAQEPAPTTATVKEGATFAELLPLTAENLRGHKMLYDEGWYVVSSSRKALAFAKEKSIKSFGETMREVRSDIARHSGGYAADLKGDLSGAVETGKEVVVEGTARSGEIFVKTHDLALTEYAYSKETFQRAMDSLIKGNLTLGKRTEEERRELVGLPGNYFKHLKSDFSNLRELTDAANRGFADKIEIGWDSAFHKATQAFRDEYDRSGRQPNSLMALGPILAGYLKAIYHGVAAPTAKTIVKGGAKGSTEVLFLPVAGATMVTGRTIESVGLTLYYTGKTGVKIVSPTVEGGLLSGLSLLSLSAVPATYVTGGTVGAMNQVAFTTAGPVVGVAEGVATTAVDTAKYVSFVAYDSGKGATKVVINQASSGVVLGYNALTALPTHLLLGAMDTVVFLAYDGPKLLLASTRGKVGQGDTAVALEDLPVGTVVDLQKLRQEHQVEVEVLSEDNAVLREVLEKLPQDLTVPPPTTGKE